MMTVPALMGLSPRSEVRIAFSTTETMGFSQGLTVRVRASSTLMLATWLSGTSEP